MENNSITAMQNKYIFFGLMTFDELQHLCFVKYVMVLIRSEVCDNGTLVQILCFWTYPSSCLFFKIQRFGDWTLSPSSGKTYSVGPH
jgi:hypothetical protein